MYKVFINFIKKLYALNTEMEETECNIQENQQLNDC